MSQVEIEQRARDIARANKCGATINGMLVLCCDERLNITRYDPRSCDCLLQAKAEERSGPKQEHG